MNLILFESHEIESPLGCGDARVIHVLDTLRMGIGDRFDAGVVNGPRGKARIVGINPGFIKLEFEWREDPTRPDPIDLIVGLPRPQSSRRILHDAAELGVRNVAFAATERSDPNYAKSSLWSSGEWRRHLIDGAQQAFDTRIPKVSWNRMLTDALDRSEPGDTRVAFDNYEAAGPFPALMRSIAAARDSRAAAETVSLAFGPERGWSEADRQLLRSAGFTLASLGPRVMKVETAIITAMAILRSELGWS